MTSQIIPVDPFDFIIFGGTGDLAERKLLPALFHRQETSGDPEAHTRTRCARLRRVASVKPLE